jgi:alpha-galactosidase
VRDLWTKKESSAVKGGYSVDVPGHGVVMVRLKP